MFLSRLQRRISAWVALLALVWGALAPTVTQAMVGGSERAEWLEVCSVSGMLWVKADTGEVAAHPPEGSLPADSGAQHCPWCTLHGGGAGLPPGQSVLEPTPRLSEQPLALFEAPRATAPWTPAQSRAPPFTA
jgi:hypothetical protein